jgi:WD40 repeat protein
MDDLEHLLQQANRCVAQVEGVHLNDLQMAVLRGALLHQDYKQIAKNTGKTVEHIRKIGSRLWKTLSQALGEPVTKPNCREALRRSGRQSGEQPGESVAVQQPLAVDPAPRLTAQTDWGSARDIPGFVGRTAELASLRQWILGDRCRIVSILGLGGMGKTAMALKLGKGGIGKTDLCLTLAQGMQREFEFVIWRSLLNAPRLETLLTQIVWTLSKHQELSTPPVLEAQIDRLLHYLQQHRCLIIFDNAESILSHPNHGGYRPGYEGYGSLLEAIATRDHQSCLLITSREPVGHLDRFRGAQGPVRQWELGGLDVAESQALFAQIGEFSGTEAQWQQVVNFYNGNPLALELAAQHIQAVFAGDLAGFLGFEQPVFQDLQQLLDWHLNRLTELEREVLYWLAIHREPVTIQALQADLVSPVARKQLPQTLQSLGRQLPLEKSGSTWTLQPVLMEHLSDRLIEAFVAELSGGQLQQCQRYALLQAQAQDYVRDSQRRILLQPVQQRLVEVLRGQPQVEQQLRHCLEQMRRQAPRQPGYGGGNIFNLLGQMQAPIVHHDFSQLALWQADLRHSNLQGLRLTQVDFYRSVFIQAIGGTHALAFSPDGQLLALGDADGQIQILRLADGQIVACLGKHPWWTVSLCFSPDGKKLVSTSLVPTLKVWDVERYQLLYELTDHTQWVWCAKFSPDGQTIASGSDDTTIKLWDAETGKLLHTLNGEQGWVISLDFSPDGRHLVSAGFDGSLNLWDLEMQQCIRTIPAHEAPIWTVAFHPQGRTLASCGFDRTIRLWDAATGDCQQVLLGHKKEIKVIAFSPDGQSLASGCFEPAIRFWDVATGQCRGVGGGHLSGIRALAFSPDNQTVVTGDNDQMTKFWNARTGACLKTIQGHANWVMSVAYSPDGTLIAASYLDHQVRLWDAQTHTCLKTLSGHQAMIWAIAFSPDGQCLASCGDDEVVQVWDVATGALRQSLHYVTPDYHGSSWTVAFSPDGQMLASSGQDTLIKLWDLATGQCVRVLQGHLAWVWSVVFSPDGTTLASAGDDQSIRLWDLASGDCTRILEGHANKVKALAYDQTGNLLFSGGDEGVLRCFQVASGQCVQAIAAHGSILFDLDCQLGYVATASSDGTAKVWDLSGRCVAVFAGHTDRVNSVSLSPDCATVASASFDGTIQLWECASGGAIATLQVPRPYDGMDISGCTGLTPGQMETLERLGAIAG